jgi:hypothetical protein
MKNKHLFSVLALLMMGLITISCKISGGDGGDGDATNPPNIVSDPCASCTVEEYIGSGTGIRFFSYVKNIGGDGDITMTIASSSGSTSQKFNLKAATSYVFQASVPVEASASNSFTYQAQFPGSPGYTDTHAISGYRTTGSPFDLQMNPK